MASLLQGAPQTATSYSSTSTETPKWMQDAIYNQIQLAQNAAATPYQPYPGATVAPLSPLQQQSAAQVQAMQGKFAPTMSTVQTELEGLSKAGTAAGLTAAQNPYLHQDMSSSALQAGQNLYGQASGMDIVGAAAPYLQEAGKSSVENIGQYMNPYQQSVLNTIAKQGGRNLTENLLPGVSDSFIKAGQFGSSRMGDFGERALRDTQEAILREQSQAAQAGYTQALDASQTDLSRYGQLASTAGGLTGQQMQNLTGLGSAQTSAGQTQQQAGINAAQATQAAQASDYARQQSALAQMAAAAQQQQSMGFADAAALGASGAEQQAQQQAVLNAAKMEYDKQIAYPQAQLDWLSTQVRGMQPSVPVTTTLSSTSSGATYSPSVLSQLAGAGLAAKAIL